MFNRRNVPVVAEKRLDIGRTGDEVSHFHGPDIAMDEHLRALRHWASNRQVNSLTVGDWDRQLAEFSASLKALKTHRDNSTPFHFNLPFPPGAWLGKAISVAFRIFRRIPVSR